MTDHSGEHKPHGLDLVKAMPDEWSDEQRLAAMVRAYDDLRAACNGHPWRAFHCCGIASRSDD